MNRARSPRLALFVLCAFFIAVAAATALPAAAPANPGDFLWTLPLDPTLDVDTLSDCARGPDGGVYVCGTQGSPAAADIWVAKYSPAGIEEWTRVWPGFDGLNDYAYGIAVDRDGNAFICGSTGRLPDSRDSVLLKFDAGGVMQYASIIDPMGLRDGADAIALVSAGNVYVTGWSETLATASDAYTARFSPTDGSLVWTSWYSGPADDFTWGLAVTAAGTSYAAGETGTADGSTDALLVKTTAGGLQAWAQRWNGPAGRNDDWESVVIGRSERVYVAGDSDYFGACDASIARYSKAGTLLWSRAWTTSGSGKDFTEDLAVDRRGDAWVATFSELASGFTRGALIKWSKTGVRRFARTIGSAAAPARLNAVTIDAGGSVYVGGSIDNTGAGGWNLLAAKYTPGGTRTWLSWLDVGGDDAIRELILGGSTSLYACGRLDGGNRAVLARIER